MARLPGQPPEADAIAERGTKAWRQAVNANRQWTGNQLWQAQANQNLNLSDPDAVSSFLATLGITDERGGGRHARNLFMGNLPSEGFGMGFRGIPFAMEQYMPDWKWSRDRQVQSGALTPAQSDQKWVPGMAPPAQSGLGAPAPSFTAPTPGFAPTPGDVTGSGEDPWTAAQNEFKKKRPGLTLGSLGGY